MTDPEVDPQNPPVYMKHIFPFPQLDTKPLNKNSRVCIINILPFSVRKKL